MKAITKESLIDFLNKNDIIVKDDCSLDMDFFSDYIEEFLSQENRQCVVCGEWYPADDEEYCSDVCLDKDTEEMKSDEEMKQELKNFRG